MGIASLHPSYALLRSTLRSIRGMLACGSHDPRYTWPRSCRMGRAKAKPIDGFREVMGIASLHPSCALRCAASGACWPVDHTIPATPGREVVGWVERSDTHRWLPRSDGYRFAPPILRSTLRSIRGMLACGSHDPRYTWPRSCRMGRAKAKPIDGFREVMGIASLHPSYALRCAASGACWPVDHTIPATPGREVVEWVERSETHRWLPRGDGYRFAPPIVRPTLRSIRGMLACGSHDPRCTWPRSRRMGRAQRNPSMASEK